MDFRVIFKKLGEVSDAEFFHRFSVPISKTCALEW